MDAPGTSQYGPIGVHRDLQVMSPTQQTLHGIASGLQATPSTPISTISKLIWTQSAQQNLFGESMPAGETPNTTTAKKTKRSPSPVDTGATGSANPPTQLTTNTRVYAEIVNNGARVNTGSPTKTVIMEKMEVLKEQLRLSEARNHVEQARSNDLQYQYEWRAAEFQKSARDIACAEHAKGKVDARAEFADSLRDASGRILHESNQVQNLKKTLGNAEAIMSAQCSVQATAMSNQSATITAEARTALQASKQYSDTLKNEAEQALAIKVDAIQNLEFRLSQAQSENSAANEQQTMMTQHFQGYEDYVNNRFNMLNHEETQFRQSQAYKNQVTENELGQWQHTNTEMSARCFETERALLEMETNVLSEENLVNRMMECPSESTEAYLSAKIHSENRQKISQIVTLQSELAEAQQQEQESNLEVTGWEEGYNDLFSEYTELQEQMETMQDTWWQPTTTGDATTEPWTYRSESQNLQAEAESKMHKQMDIDLKIAENFSLSPRATDAGGDPQKEPELLPGWPCGTKTGTKKAATILEPTPSQAGSTGGDPLGSPDKYVSNKGEAPHVTFQHWPNAPAFRNWKKQFERTVSSASARPQAAFHWILEIDEASTMEELENSGDFETLSAKIATGLSAIFTGAFQRQITLLEDRA